MDGSSRGRKPPLQVRREFAGFRLEEQVMIRVYELAVPVIRRSTGAARLPIAGDRRADYERQSQRIAKGA